MLNLGSKLKPLPYQNLEKSPESTTSKNFSVHDKINLSVNEEEEGHDEDDEDPTDMHLDNCFNYMQSNSSSHFRKSSYTVHKAVA